MSRVNSHRLRNTLHTALLLAGMAGLAWFITTLIWDATLGLMVVAGVLAGMILVPGLPKDFVLRLYRARPVSVAEFPQGARIVAGLAERAELPAMPRLYHLPSAMPNAFSVGDRDDAAIAISDGLLRLLNLRELQGVLAHEVAHIANRDLRIMNLADVMSRVTSLSSLLGQIMLLINLPLVLTGRIGISWLAIMVLIFSPTIMNLLQLALSRSREYAADLDAAMLTGDPLGLASALTKLERSNGRLWEEILLPGRRIPDPSLLRTHPPTEERVRRLRELAGSLPPRDDTAGRGNIRHRHPPITARPRWHRTGVWY